MDALASIIDGFGEDPVTTLAGLALAGGALLLFAIVGLAGDRKDLRRRASAGVQMADPAGGAPGKAKAQPFERLVAASLEIRAGKTFTEAFERLGERLGIEEAMMLATLLQQSAELSTSLSRSLRVYSDEMRNKRLSRAEEKAYSLPAKLTVPLILFVFPVLLFVLMLPVVIRISGAGLGG